MCLSRSSLSNGSGPPAPDPVSCTEIDPGGADDWTAVPLFAAAVAWPLDLMATKRGLEAMATAKERLLLTARFTRRDGGTHLEEEILDNLQSHQGRFL